MSLHRLVWIGCALAVTVGCRSPTEVTSDLVNVRIDDGRMRVTNRVSEPVGFFAWDAAEVDTLDYVLCGPPELCRPEDGIPAGQSRTVNISDIGGAADGINAIFLQPYTYRAVAAGHEPVTGQAIFIPAR
jgi:hypothetical protein